MTEPPRPGARAILGLLALSAVVGLGVSLTAWGFLEGTHQLQQAIFYDSAPVWWPLPVLALGGVVVALAIERLPGNGGHSAADGLNTGTTSPAMLPGVLLAAAATIAFGAVLGPEAPLIALGSGLGMLAIQRIRSDAPGPVVNVVAAAGSFAAISFIFGSPLIGAVILLEAAGLDRQKLQIVLPCGLLAAGIGSLVSLGMGSWTGLSTADYALGTLTLPSFARPDVADFAWTIPLAVAVALGSAVIFRGAQALRPLLARRLIVLLPLAGMAIAGCAILFDQTTSQSSSQVLFDGQDQLPGLVQHASTWTIGALVLVLLLKGVAWSISLAGFRGGPTFPAVYLGGAAGVLASHLPGFPITPAVGVGIAAATVAVLRLPLAAVVLATLLVAKAGVGAGPLIIVGTVVAFVTSLAIDRRRAGAAPQAAAEADAEAKAETAAVVPA